jgi:hypothetical protein
MVKDKISDRESDGVVSQQRGCNDPRGILAAGDLNGDQQGTKGEDDER